MNTSIFWGNLMLYTQFLMMNAPFFSFLGQCFRDFKFYHVFDILLISGIVFLLWYALRRSKVAMWTAVVIAGLALSSVIASLLRLEALSYLLGYILQISLIGAVILMEMRIIEHLGKNGKVSFLAWIKSLLYKKQNKSMAIDPIEAICQAAVDLSRTKTGGLIVIERANKLDDLIHTGVDIDAVVSPYLIRNIFYEGAPLHDGALIIRDGRIFAAGCILPITHRLDVNPDLGTRHRAAIGMSENSDAVIIVISEESGIISLACNSEFSREYNSRTLKSELIRLLGATTDEEEND